MNQKALSELFYEQCAGTYSGHMANVPNNPLMFGLVAAATEVRSDNCYAASKNNFANLLREIADQLHSETKESK